MSVRSNSERRLHWGLLGAIVVAGIVLRLAFLGEPMRYDEAYTFDAYAVHSARFITSTYVYPNNQIFSTLLTHLAWRLFGNHLWTVRFPADLAGLLIPPAAYAVARELYDSSAGLWAAGLTAVAAPLVDYSVDGRGYTLGVLLILGLVWLGARLLEGDSLVWLPFVGVAALAVYTIPTMAYGVALVAVWMGGNALVVRRRSAWTFLMWLSGALVVAGGLALALYEPVLGQPGWTFVQPLAPTWANLGHLISSVWSNWNRSWPDPLEWLVALAFLAGLATHSRQAKHPVPLAAAALATLVVIAAAAPISPFVRTWLYLVPVYLITAAAGLSWACGALIGARGASRRTATAGGQPGAPGGVGRLLHTAALVLIIGSLGVAVALRGQHGAEQTPSSDNHLVSFIRGQLRPGEQVELAGGLVYYPALYYFARYRYTPPLFARPPEFARRGARLPAHLLVITVRPMTPDAVLAALRGQGVRLGSCRVTLVRRMEYLDAFAVTRE